MVNFKTLKSKKTNIEKLTAALQKETKGSGFAKDERYWRPEVDKAGNGYAVIRFLPTPPVDEVGDDGIPWAKLFHHSFQGPTGSWYIENSLTTLGKDDPVSEYNTKLWHTGIESNKEIVRKRKRKLTYISNIVVISDPKHPEYDGKQFLFEYGKKIFEKITLAMNPPPEFEDETPFDPFDLWTGANLKLKIRNVDSYRNYEKSEFEKPAPLFGGDDEKLEALYDSLPSLLLEIDASKFKPYADLKHKLDKVLGMDTSLFDQPEASTSRLPVAPPSNVSSVVVEEDDDVGENFFKNLAKS